MEGGTGGCSLFIFEDAEDELELLKFTVAAVLRGSDFGFMDTPLTETEKDRFLTFFDDGLRLCIVAPLHADMFVFIRKLQDKNYAIFITYELFVDDHNEFAIKIIEQIVGSRAGA